MQCNASLAGVPVQVLFDTGASECFMNAGFARRMGFKVHSVSIGCHTCIFYANGQTSPVLGMLASSLKLCGTTFHVRFFLASLAENLDVIMGLKWLKNHDAVWHVGEDTLTLSKNGRICNVTKPCLPTEPTAPPFAVLSYAEFMKARRRNTYASVSVVTLHQIDEAIRYSSTSEILPDAVASLLKKFSDVFGDPPPGLPPERGGVSHTIPLVHGAEPPFKPMYRLSKPERLAVQEELTALLSKGFV